MLLEEELRDDVELEDGTTDVCVEDLDELVGVPDAFIGIVVVVVIVVVYVTSISVSRYT